MHTDSANISLALHLSISVPEEAHKLKGSPPKAIHPNTRVGCMEGSLSTYNSVIVPVSNAVATACIEQGGGPK